MSVICSLRFVSEPLIARLDPRCCGEINWTMVSAIPLYWAPLERSAPESVSMEKPNRFWEVRFLESEASWTSCMRRRRTRSSNAPCTFQPTVSEYLPVILGNWSRLRRSQEQGHSKDPVRANTNVSPIPSSNCFVSAPLFLCIEHIRGDPVCAE